MRVLSILLCVLLAASSLWAKAPSKLRTPEPKNHVAEKIRKEQDKETMQLTLKARAMQLEGQGTRLTETKSGQVKQVTTTCPVCKQGFQAWDVEYAPLEKGIDRDFCKHTNFKSAYDFDLWICPRCSYTHFKNYFELPVDENMRKKVLDSGINLMRDLFIKQLQTNIQKMGFLLDQEDIPTVIKYTMMEYYLPDMNLPWSLKTKFYLQFAWTERIRMVAPIIDPALSIISTTTNENLRKYAKKNNYDNIISNQWAVIEFLQAQGEAGMDDNQKMMQNIYMAGQLNRLGYPSEAHDYLKKTVSLQLPNKFRDIIKFKHDLLDHEYKLLKEAVICIKETLRENDPQLEKQPYIYTLGEEYRRLHMFAEAQLWFTLAGSMPVKEDELYHTWAKEQTELMPKADKLPPASEEEVIFLTSVERDLSQPKPAEQEELLKLKNNPELIKEWLGILQQATSYYYSKFQFDPASIGELTDLGLLEQHRILSKVADRYFALKVQKDSKKTEQRFTIICLLPYQDNEGPYYLSIQDGSISRLRHLDI